MIFYEILFSNLFIKFFKRKILNRMHDILELLSHYVTVMLASTILKVTVDFLSPNDPDQSVVIIACPKVK